METKVLLDDVEYNLEDLSTIGLENLRSLQFTESRIKELQNLKAVMRRARKTYFSNLKREVISGKSGFHLEDE